MYQLRIQGLLPLLFFLFFFTLPLKSQYYNLPFRTLTEKQGLSNQFNAHFSTDTTGFFWTSSRDGLNRFDGKAIKVFRPKQKGKAIDPNITSQVFLQKSGARWFTSGNALHRLNSRQDSIDTWIFEEKEATYYHLIFLEQDSILWVSAHNYLYRIAIHQDTIKPEKICPYQAFHCDPIIDQQGRLSGIIRPLIESGAGIETLYFQETGQIAIDSFYHIEDRNQKPLYIQNITLTPNNTIWIPSKKGLIHFDPRQPEQASTFTPTDVSPEFIDIALWRDSLIWAADNRGSLWLFDIKQQQFVRHLKYLLIDGAYQKPQSIDALYIDPFDNLWFSSFDYGLSFTNLNNSKFRQLISPEEQEQSTENRVLSIQRLSMNKYLYHQFYRGIFQLSNSFNRVWQQTAFPQTCVPDEAISGFLVENQKSIWIYSANQLFLSQLQGQSCHQILTTQNSIYDLDHLSEDKLLVTTPYTVLMIDKRAPELPPDTLFTVSSQSHNLNKIFLISDEDLILAPQNNNKLSIIQANPPFSLKSEHFGQGYINDVAAEEQFAWLASSNGLYQYDFTLDSITKIELPDEQLDRSFVSVTSSKDYLWLGSYQGLHRYHKQARRIEQFSASDGLRNLQFFEAAKLQDTQNNLFFGGNRGITQISTRDFRMNNIAPKLRLLSFRTGAIPRDPTQRNGLGRDLKVLFTNNDIHLSFAVIEYSEPENNQLRGWLIKNQQDTIRWFDNTTIDIPDLQEGAYIFQAIAFNGDAFPSKETFHLNFTILPPWYRTWWARLLGFLATAALLYAWYRYRIRQIEKRETFKRKEAEFRQKEAEYKQLVAETETAVLRLQMNPHFLFNSMNSINRYIIERDIDSASAYLDQFARLMRLTLELSAQPLITIEEEIEFLELYLQTESRRLTQPLSYHFHISPEIDPEDSLVPTMILQPFVENAIWHGLSPKKAAGKITIEFRLKAQQLLCTVSDDGVGRAYHQGKTRTLHPSKAIDITRRRLELLETQLDTSTDIQLGDLHPGSAYPGTRVEIRLPIIA